MKLRIKIGVSSLKPWKISGLSGLFVAAICLALIAIPSQSATLAEPSVCIPEARMAIGVSYNLGAYTISNREIPSILNNFSMRVSYAPSALLNFGLDGGASQFLVVSDTTATDTLATFQGKYAIAFGGHLKFSSPFFIKKSTAIIFQGAINYFNSTNDYKANYAGLDIQGIAGLQFHINKFGYITIGPNISFINGTNKGYEGTTGSFSNINNIRGYIAIDYFPKMAVASKNKSFISFEFSASPAINYQRRAPLEELSFSISIGAITPRLYGQETSIEWEP